MGWSSLSDSICISSVSILPDTTMAERAVRKSTSPGEGSSKLPRSPGSSPRSVPRSATGSPKEQQQGEYVDYGGEPEDDATSDYTEDFLSDTTSINSEITAYRFENGRRYHAYKDGAYWGPNDERQNEQLDLAHHMFVILLENRLVLAPICEDIQNVLDVGTGTGIWAIDFADEYPSAEVIGFDLSPIQPSFVPPNLKFEVDDAEEPWIHPTNHYDLVHVRALYGSIADWPAFYRNALRHIRPGGWIDQLEMSIEFRSDDGTVMDDHVLAVWSKTFIEAGERLGKTFRIADLAKGYMQEAGFQNVTEERFKLPVGPWSKDKRLRKLGMWNLAHCEGGIEGWAMALLTRLMGWSYSEVQVFLAQMRQGLRDPNIRAYFYVVGVYGQKL